MNTPSTSKSTTPTQPLNLGEPYCGACGYQLSGCTDAARCPECGRPIIEVLTRAGKLGKRYRSAYTMFGLPIIDIAFGPSHTETFGKARGIIALGDQATGWLAIGGRAFGIVAIGGFATGLFSIGGMSIGLISAWGGLALGAIANGGVAIGLLASGGLGIGFMASGGMGIGWYSVGGSSIGVHTITPQGGDPAAVVLFQRFGWFFGPLTWNAWSVVQPMLVTVGSIMAAGVGVLIAAALGHRRAKAEAQRDAGETFSP